MMEDMLVVCCCSVDHFLFSLCGEWGYDPPIRTFKCASYVSVVISSSIRGLWSSDKNGGELGSACG